MATSDGLTASSLGSFVLPIHYHVKGDAFSVFKLKVECFIGGAGVKTNSVYLAHDLQNRAKKKVVKLYLTENSDIGLRVNKTFLNEVEVMSKLNSPYIMSLESAVSFPNHHAILMEFCQRGTLANRIKRMSHHQIDHFFLQIYCGLIYMHSQNIVHRDIKLDNILVHANNTVRIADFDLSVILPPDQSMVFGCVGTRPYMAPEMLEKESQMCWFDGYKLDSYAFGVLYWCMFFQSNVQRPVNYLDILAKCNWPSGYACYRNILENLLCPVPEARWNMTQLRQMLTTIPWLASRIVNL